MEKDTSKVDKQKKPTKPYVKFIWLVLAVAVDVVGIFLRAGNPELSFAAGVAITAVAFILSIIAAQYQGEKREMHSAMDDDGRRIERGKYFIQSVIYYLFIIVSVIILFSALYICNFMSL